jgi:hypothetical protein
MELTFLSKLHRPGSVKKLKWARGKDGSTQAETKAGRARVRGESKWLNPIRFGTMGMVELPISRMSNPSTTS